jgi:hypothetical protein
MIHAPWTDEQVAKLAEWQTCRWVHPFTCGGDHGTQKDRVLTPTREGWVCRTCGYTQNWAHEFMFKGAPAHPLSRLFPASCKDGDK